MLLDEIQISHVQGRLNTVLLFQNDNCVCRLSFQTELRARAYVQFSPETINLLSPKSEQIPSRLPVF